MDGSVSSSPRGVEVEVTERGLPVASRLDARQLATSPAESVRFLLLARQQLLGREGEATQSWTMAV